MDNANEISLESIISAIISTKYKDVPPTEDQFNEVADTMRAANASLFSVTDDEFQNIKKHLRQEIVVTMDSGICLPNLKNGHQSWLPARRADIDFFYWDRYRRYLGEVKHWNPRVVSRLGQVSDEILDLCGDPKGDNFKVRGLILGDVQSGKTSNYTAIANKAADVGYELIIVLAGISELLRQQTQRRLDKEFCGRQSNLYLDPKSTVKPSPVGVGRYGDNKKIASFTSEANDFDAGVLKSNNLALDNVNCPILLVVKKNKTILNNLCKWLKNNNALNRNGQIEKSLLIIDDEADNASINTKNPDADPTAINSAIRQLLSLFAKNTYLAVTATPFANIFIDPSPEAEDLFPADFIYALEAPNNYIGAARIFSDIADKKNMLVTIDVEKLKKIIPDNHKKTLKINDVADDMYEAVEYFLLANAIRDYRHETTEHRSMMIHVSRFIDVQRQVAEIINTWLDQVKSDLINYSKLPVAEAEKITSIHNLHIVWNKYSLKEISGVSWAVILKDYLYRAVAPIDVREVNGSTGSATLDYDNHKDDGLRVIAVGGNTLSRGLTLEGLMVTYFYRNTNMYDTLMQMGRWFGYRPNYDDLVKIWLSQSAIDWYGKIFNATQDLRTQLFKMKVAKQTPSEFGLKVRQEPGSLIVTARNKMRTAKTIKCPITVSGHLLETPRLFASVETLQQNAAVVEKFIERLGFEGKRVAEADFKTHGNYYWEGVPGDLISELLDNFKTHPWHLSYNGKALAEYVAKHTWNNGWDVALMNTGEGNPYDKQLKCGNDLLNIVKTEQRDLSLNGKILGVSGSKLRVGSGGCTRIGLSENELEEAKARFYEDYQGNKTKPSVPDYAYLIKERNPILMIHIIEANYIDCKDKGFPKFIYALGVGFPDDGNKNNYALYQVNLIELANWMDPDDETDE
jgi:hypothetical protein